MWYKDFNIIIDAVANRVANKTAAIFMDIKAWRYLFPPKSPNSSEQIEF